MHMELHEVVVIGGLHHNTLGVIRSLGEAGLNPESIFVIIVNDGQNGKNLLSASKYVCMKNIAYVDSYDAIVPWLTQHANFEGYRVLICCADGAAEAVISAKEELQTKYKLPEASMNIHELMEKSNQSRVAVECGLSIPKYRDYEIGQDIDWQIFPCIIKPYKSVVGAGKADIRIVYSRDELMETIRTLQADKIQIQQYIDKEMEFQLIGCSLNKGSTIIIPGFTKILRQPKNTNTGYLLYSPISDLDYDSQAVETFIRKIGYSGLFSVEFIRGKDGKDYFLEINMRNDGNAYCVKTAGVNLPYIWAYYQCNGELPESPISVHKAVYFIPDFNDLKVAIKKVGLLKWIKEFCMAESHSIYNNKDMKPFLFEVRRQIGRIFRGRR